MAVDVIPAKTEAGWWRKGLSIRCAPPLTLLIFLGPVAAGLIGTLLPAFGYLPALGGDHLSFDPWRALARYPGVETAALRSLVTGLIATGLSVALVLYFIAAFHGTTWFQWARTVLAPLLSIPHAAMAMGLAFLLAPSGWIVRLISPWATGFDRPPDLALAPDPYGWSLVLALVIKEVPFLFLMTLGALGQIPAQKSMQIAQSLGYDRPTGWLKTVLPQLYGQIRLPIFAVLAFSVSVVDVALILTVTPSPTLGVLILRWANDPDLSQNFVAAAGACIQCLLVLSAIGFWVMGERIVSWLGLAWIRKGRRRVPHGVKQLTLTGMSLAAGLGIAGLIGLVIWSFTQRWRFPDTLPSTWSLDNWGQGFGRVAEPLATTLWVGLAAAGVALILVMLCLEAEQRTGRRPTHRALWLLYLPLIVPQIAFLFGAQILMVVVGIDGHWAGLIWAHLLFVLPYIFLSLSEPYRALDPRFSRTAACLGASPWRIFRQVKMPMLLRPILIAFAVGFAVSVGEYLPTIFAGAGRLTTLTTEAVALAGGGDRRLIGTLVVLQSILPLILFAIAAAAPFLIHRSAFAGKKRL
ncbi:MAG: ABC transporter permease [Rhodospirillales bacterium]|jgi:putative thiamine transport system permease protein|uniref:ABC transporter permease n=1 Tax=Hwanghaeella sp. 1Z406 TaxID=3402811 RepID=UPI000C8C9B1B|nr:ABC transporter permease [Rhodospirillales bacterium]|tara:strand:+ start:51355 stop:53091 length:1737 start_codon:yes stop_codon:yes gene_type:complete